MRKIQTSKFLFAIILFTITTISLSNCNSTGKLVQKGEIEITIPDYGEFNERYKTGEFYYSVPYAFTPSLEIVSERNFYSYGCSLINQNEKGFSWDCSADDLNFNIVFQWKATGIRWDSKNSGSTNSPISQTSTGEESSQASTDLSNNSRTEESLSSGNQDELDTRSSCPYSVSSSITKIAHPPFDPLEALSMIEPLEEAKQSLQQVAGQKSCQREQEILSPLVENYWEIYISLSHERNNIQSDNPYFICTSGCGVQWGPSITNTDSCYEKCESDRNSALTQANNERDREITRKNDFFRNLNSISGSGQGTTSGILEYSGFTVPGIAD